MNVQNIITIFGTVLLVIIIIFSTYAFKTRKNLKNEDIIDNHKNLRRKWLIYTIISCTSSVILLIMMLILYLI